MTIHQPPRLATWVLKRLGSRVDDALVGDLFEAYQTRRSAAWYWRQVGAAIVGGACRDVRDHLPVALGAVVIGLVVAATPVWVLINTPADSLSTVPLPVSIQVLAAWLVAFGSALLSGMFVGRVFRAHRAAAVLSLAAAIVAAGALLLPRVADIGSIALGGVLLFGAVAVVGGGSLASAREA